MSALTASPPVCDIAERPHGRRRKKVLPLLVTMNRSNRQPGSPRAPAGSPPPVRFPSSGYGTLLSPPSAGSHLRAPLCSTVFPRPPASRLRPAPAPPVSVMRRPGLAVLRKRRRQRPAPSCPFPSITARMPFPLRQRPLSPVCAHGPAAASRRPFSVPAAEKETFLSFPVKGVIIFLYYQYVIDCFRKKFSFFPQDTLIPATTKAENFSTLM